MANFVQLVGVLSLCVLAVAVYAQGEYLITVVLSLEITLNYYFLVLITIINIRFFFSVSALPFHLVMLSLFPMDLKHFN